MRNCFSLIETAKANGLEPSAYVQYVDPLEVLLPWNVPLESGASLKKVAQYGSGQ